MPNEKKPIVKPNSEVIITKDRRPNTKPKKPIVKGTVSVNLGRITKKKKAK